MVIQPANKMKDTIPEAILTDQTHYILKEDYEYSWEVDAFDINMDNPGKIKLANKIIVKAGFRWDGASVPKLLWHWGFKPDSKKHRAAALIHDFIYIHKGKLPEGSMISTYDGVTNQVQHGSFSRKDADRMFGRMMKEAKVHKIKRSLMKWAVIFFGWIYWKDGKDVYRVTILKGIVVLLVIDLAFNLQVVNYLIGLIKNLFNLFK